MIEDALVVATEMDETTAVYLLSMASIEVTERLHAAESAASEDAD